MPKSLADIIKDAAATNETVFEIGGEKFTLADLRGMHTTEQQAIAARAAEVERIGKEAQGYLELLTKAAAEAEKNNRREEPAPKVADWRKNPLYEDLIPVIETLEATVKSSAQQSADLKKSLDTSQAVYALERLRRQWAEAKVKPKDKTFEQTVQEVLAAKETDETGLPTLDKYLHRATEPDRIQAASDAAVAKAKLEWEAKHRMDSVQKPGARFNVKGKGEKPPIANLNELTSELVSGDADIARAMEEVPV